MNLMALSNRTACIVLLISSLNAGAASILSGDGTETCSLPTAVTCSVTAINPAASYQAIDPLGQGAIWVSYADTGRPGTVGAAPGYVATIYEQFFAAQGSALSLQVWADNWVEIFVDDLLVFSTESQAMFLPGQQAILNYLLPTGGAHTLSILGYQAGDFEYPPGNPFGIFYSGTVSEVPIPGSLGLLGVGLAALTITRARKGSITVV
jgi:hypothetical protein